MDGMQLDQESNMEPPEYKSAGDRSDTKPTAVQQNQPCQYAVQNTQYPFHAANLIIL
jgi:hypothetical protein